MKQYLLILAQAKRRACQKVANIHHSLFFPPVIIFIAVMIAAVFGWQAAKQSLNHEISTAANDRVDTAEQSLKEYMISYEQILRGGVGLFRGSNNVTSDEWDGYLDAFQVDEHYSGVQGIGFAKIFSADDLPAINAYMTAQGVNDFIIDPAGPPRGVYAAVMYAKAVAEKNQPIGYGFDMYSEPTRRASMLRARDTGKVIMTSSIQLHSPKPSVPCTGFNMYAPYYKKQMPANTVEERQAAVQGYVFASFRSDVFFKSAIDNSNSDTMAFAVTVRHNGADEPLFTSPTYNDITRQSKAIQLIRPIEAYGQTMDIHFIFAPDALVNDIQLNRPLGILFFGIFSAVLISTIVLLLMRARSRDLNAQKDRAVELAKDELLSLASHQLRTPATGVKQYVGMVLQGFSGKVPKSQRKLLEKAYASNDRQLRIINEILHLAKIDSGRIVLAKQNTNLNDLVADIINEQMPDITAAKHSIDVDLPPKPIFVHADIHMLRMAIENLLSNAIKYTHEGGKITARVSKHHTKAYVAISDTGVGIRTNDIGKVFQQFSRLPNDMSQQVGGTGIGLYLVKHLVELHNGSVSVQSVAGRGSIFTIALPMDVREKTIKNITV
jgi:signal transduction histidine kinase